MTWLYWVLGVPLALVLLFVLVAFGVGIAEMIVEAKQDEESFKRYQRDLDEKYLDKK